MGDANRERQKENGHKRDNWGLGTGARSRCGKVFGQELEWWGGKNRKPQKRVRRNETQTNGEAAKEKS